jgi:hypothetical protein
MLFPENLIRALLIFSELRSRHCQRALLEYHYQTFCVGFFRAGFPKQPALPAGLADGH